MATVHLKPWQRQPRSDEVYTTGYVEASQEGVERAIPVYVHSPHDDINDPNLAKIINFNGIIVGAESMRRTAQVQSRLGYAAITLNYSNTSELFAPVEHNARDGLAVMDAFDVEIGRLLGLSMGGAVAAVLAAMVAKRSERLITNLDLVAPGGFTDEVVSIDRARVTQAFQHESYHELNSAWRHPPTAINVAISSLVNCGRRPNAVVAEARELLRETMYPYLLQLRDKSPATVVTLAHGHNDSLIPREELVASMRRHEQEAGIPLVDIEVPYFGTHSALVYNSALTERIVTASDGATSKMLLL